MNVGTDRPADGVVVLVNPAAAGGRVGKLWEALQRSAAEAAALPSVQVPQAEAVREEIARWAARGMRRLLVVGGDGSVHLAANVLLELGCAATVDLGLVPAGTGSDLARTLGLPREPQAALRHGLFAASRPIDVLELCTADGRRRFVVNVASAGISGCVDETVNALPRRTSAAYLRATLSALVRYRPRHVGVRADGELLFDGAVFLVAVANGRCFGHGMRVAPRARPDDAVADVIVVPAIGRLRLLSRLPALYRGTHLSDPRVRWCQARTVELEPREDLPPFDLDGEVFPSAPARITVRPGALRMVC